MLIMPASLPLRSTGMWRTRWRAFSAPGLFDHLIGQREQLRRHVEAKRLCGFEIDDELEFRGLLNRKVGRLCAFQYFVHEFCRATIELLPIHSVRHQSTCFCKISAPENRRQPSRPSRHLMRRSDMSAIRSA